jgi:hypothetical protein
MGWVDHLSYSQTILVYALAFDLEICGHSLGELVNVTSIREAVAKRFLYMPLHLTLKSAAIVSVSSSMSRSIREFVSVIMGWY